MTGGSSDVRLTHLHKLRLLKELFYCCRRIFKRLDSNVDGALPFASVHLTILTLAKDLDQLNLLTWHLPFVLGLVRQVGCPGG